MKSGRLFKWLAQHISTKNPKDKRIYVRKDVANKGINRTQAEKTRPSVNAWKYKARLNARITCTLWMRMESWYYSIKLLDPSIIKPELQSAILSLKNDKAPSLRRNAKDHLWSRQNLLDTISGLFNDRRIYNKWPLA